MFVRIGSRIERWLETCSEEKQEKLRGFFVRLRNMITGSSLLNRRMKVAVRFFDFIIVRSFGNRFIEFELSNICNARCVFCPYPDMLKSGKQFMHMNESTFGRSLSVFRNFEKVLISVTPTTGDTLLHPEWDRCIREILNHPKVELLTMFTNAIALDDENRKKMIALLESENGKKLSQIFFSVGGPDAASYKEIYRVDRFDVIRGNIGSFLSELKERNLHPGVHLHARLGKDVRMEKGQMQAVFNPAGYPYVYPSSSSLYHSNDAYKRNALIGYREKKGQDMKKACAYLMKTRFAADGSIWADGCVISELPGDSSLKLGTVDAGWETIESSRNNILENWESGRELPLPCRGCTMYRPRQS